MGPSNLLLLFIGALGFINIAHVTAYDIQALLSNISPSSEVFFPNDANWTDTVQRWNAWYEPDFSVAIKPASVADLQTIVKFASEYNVSFLASGGGHGYSTSFGALQNGLKIDLGFFNKTTVDADHNTMTIGGSVTFGDIMEPLSNAGKEIQTGSCPCIGMVGGTLGGGVGRYQGLHGLIIDALKSVQLVTASGDLITVSDTQNDELFWGLKGAGFNYGIVTDATYQVHDFTNNGNVLNSDFTFPAAVNETYFQVLASFGTLPAALSLYTLVRNDESLGPVIQLNAVYVGDEAEGLELLRPFMNLSHIQRNITMITWGALIFEAGWGAVKGLFCVDGQKHDMWSLGVRRLDAQTHINYFNKLAAFWSEYPEAGGSIWQIEYFPTQATTAIADAMTAYPHRLVSAHEMFSYNFDNSSVADSVDNLAVEGLEAFNATSGFDELRTYVSYAHGTEGLSTMYGEEKIPKLLDLKKKWDPKGLFVYNNPLPID